MILKLNFPIFTLILVNLVVGESYNLDNESSEGYLNILQKVIDGDVKNDESALVGIATNVEDKTRVYIGAQLKMNLFKALRAVSEKELRENSYYNNEDVKIRGRQSSSSEDNEDEDEESGASEGTTDGESTTRRPANIIPQVANLVKAIFGGNSINLTSYVQGATKFLPQSVGSQVLGVVKLLAHNPSVRWSTTLPPTPAPSSTPAPIIVPVKKVANESSGIVKTTNSSGGTGTTVKTVEKTTKKTEVVSSTTKKSEEEEEEEEEDNGRQLRLPNFNNILGSLLGATTRAPKTVNATTESASGFEEETNNKNGNDLDLGLIASGIRSGLGDLIKVVPDLFKGAREAVGLLSGLQNLLGAFGN